MSDEKQLPTHEIFAVSKDDPSNRDEKGYWNKIGAMWAHKDGKGFSIDLELLPCKEQRIVARPYEPKQQADKAA